MSEKMDGVRAYWSGSRFYSRNGNEFIAPKWFVEGLPKQPLDGELWCGRGLFQKCVGIIKKKKTTKESDDQWKFVTYLVFDAPSHKGPFEERYAWLRANIDEKNPKTYAAVVGHELCLGKDHLMTQLKTVLDLGGEGLMLREPKSKYQQGRNQTLLKVKVFHDEEALVLGHEKGTGRLSGMMGKIRVKLANGIEFKIGTGFSDAERKKPPKVGTVITFKYQELSDSGTPRFPVFLRERGDVTWDEVLELAKTKIPFSQQKKLSVKLKKVHTLLYTTVPSRDQSTGAKQVTDDDAIEPAVVEPGGVAEKSKPVCKYGKLCYQKNEAHRALFYHEEEPLAAEAPEPATKKAKSKKGAKDAGARVPCKWGKSCYRTNAEHLAKYAHDHDDAVVAAAAAADEDIEDVAASEEADVPQEELQRAATVALTATDVFASVKKDEPEVKAEEELVQVSKAELAKLKELAAAYMKHSEGESSQKKKSK